MSLNFRNRIVPKILSEFIALGFVLFIIPAIYIFELCVVLPAIYTGKNDHDDFWYYFHCVCGTFIMFNLVGNLIGVVLVDTSIKSIIVNSSQVDPSKGWHVCAVCETFSPPRAWHCSICNTCILKREHHCAFTGCCIGYHNFRYFYLFLVHLCLATIYASYFNNIFIWTLLSDDLHWMHIVRLVMPLSVLVFGIDTSMTQLYMFYYSVTLIGCLFTGILIYQQSYFVFYNQTSYERNKNNHNYDFDRMQSVRDSLGFKWYLTFFSPFVKSDLPHDGIEWISKEENCKESNKSK